MIRRIGFFVLPLVLIPMLTLRAAAAPLRFAGPNGQAIPITADAIETQLALKSGSLYGVTVLSVPPASDGVLYSEGVEVSAYDYLDREALDSCVFLPLGDETSAHLALLPNAPGGGYTPVSLTVSDRRTSVMSAAVAAERYAWALADRRYYAAIAAAGSLFT